MQTIIRHEQIKLVFDDINGSAGISRMSPGDNSNQKNGEMPVPGFHLTLTDADYGGFSNLIAGASVIPLQAKCGGVSRNGNMLSMVYLIEEYGLEVSVSMELIPGASVVRQVNRVKNIGSLPRTLTHFSSMCVMGIASDGLKNWYDDDKIRIHTCINTWEGEGQWRCASLEELGLYPCSVHQDVNAVQFRSVGSWSTSKYFPKAMIEDIECGQIWFFEIEASCGWHYEIGRRKLRDGLEGEFYMLAGSADEVQLGWYKTLQPGDSYEAVPVSFGCISGIFDDAVRESIKYKRGTLKPINPWQGEAPVIYNDYMDALWGNPTTERLLPLIDAAAEAGAGVFCIDAGWFALKGQNWGVGIGDWNSSPDRFGEGGIADILDRIKSRGMIPGVWLEMEACHYQSQAYGFDDSFFLLRHGKRIGGRRVFFDYRNRAVRKYMHEKIDSLTGIGVGYIKNDYNQSTGAGDDKGGFSPADGLYESTRAFCGFIDEVRARHPELIIENCGSGALREDCGILSHFHLQSTSDQEIYYKYPPVISGSLANVLPEQAGIWSFPYPLMFLDMIKGGDAKLKEDAYIASMADGEETVFNMVNGMCGCLYMSGRLDACDAYNMSLVKEGIEVYKDLREHIRTSYPVWPDGRLRMNCDTFSSLGLLSETGGSMTLAVWRFGTNKDTYNIDLSRWIKGGASVELIYPKDRRDILYVWNRSNGSLSVKMPGPYTARLFKIVIP